MDNQRKVIYQRAANLYGKDNQLIVAIEECDELGKEVCKYLRGEGILDGMIEELADVTIMVEQLVLMFDCDAEVKEAIEEKLQRLVRRMDRDEERRGLCDSCAFRKTCTFLTLHPKIKLKTCDDYLEGK